MQTLTEPRHLSTASSQTAVIWCRLHPSTVYRRPWGFCHHLHKFSTKDLPRVIPCCRREIKNEMFAKCSEGGWIFGFPSHSCSWQLKLCGLGLLFPQSHQESRVTLRPWRGGFLTKISTLGDWWQTQSMFNPASKWRSMSHKVTASGGWEEAISPSVESSNINT